MRSKCSPRFWRLFHSLPQDVQDLAVKNYRLWRSNPNHPSLRYKRLEDLKGLVAVRVGSHYRAVGTQRSDLIIWIWIGPHAEYDQIIRG